MAPLMGLDSNGQAIPLAQEEVVSGKYLVLFCQPEGTATDQGQRILRSLALGEQIRGLFVDEVHQVFKFHRSFHSSGVSFCTLFTIFRHVQHFVHYL